MDVDLSDPNFEPSDEDLQQLSKRAFAHVKEQSKELLRQLRERIRAPLVESDS